MGRSDRGFPVNAYEQTRAELDAYVGAWSLGCRRRLSGEVLDSAAVLRLLATGELQWHPAAKRKRKGLPATITWHGQSAEAPARPAIVAQAWEALAAIRAKRPRLVAEEDITDDGGPYLMRLRQQLARRKSVAAAELAQEYHLTVKPLYRSKYGYILEDNKGGVVACQPYSKSYHAKFGPARARYAGVISTRLAGRWVAVLYPSQGNSITCDLDTWIERREIVVL